MSNALCVRLTSVQGYGTVKFTTKEAAEAAVARYHESELEGRRLAVFIDRYQ